MTRRSFAATAPEPHPDRIYDVVVAGIQKCWCVVEPPTTPDRKRTRVCCSMSVSRRDIIRARHAGAPPTNALVSVHS